MTSENLSLWIQAAVAVAAVGAAIIALIVSAKDRHNARQIAAEDRRAGLEHARLMFDLEVLLRLSQNLERGGHTDQAVSKDMGAEAAALLNALGPNRLPGAWSNQRGGTLEEARAELENGAEPQWVKDKIEVALELRRVSDRIEELIQRRH